uniref:C2H2-type domain-containing protein n=1 Tax=Paramormyrops kingsleyae TaxID=1676925 RepID=A0A3B3TFE4_9TELE
MFTFSKIGSLNAHLRSHVDEKVHCCNYCGKRFGRADLLRSHKRTHTGERPFSCNLCTKSYGHPGQLRIHKRVHTEERPYCCPHCGKSEHNQLKVHLQTHMGETTSIASCQSPASPYVHIAPCQTVALLPSMLPFILNVPKFIKRIKVKFNKRSVLH